MNTKFASFISVIGHPLVTLSVFTVLSFFTYEEVQKALWHSVLIVAGVFLPLTLKMYWSYKKGTYTNFDVSDKAQRQSWYIFAIGLLMIVTIVLFVTDQPRALRWPVLFSLLLLTVSKMVNYFIKSSLHVSFNIFLSFLILPMYWRAGVLILVFTFLVAWARWVLKRHSVKEIISGTAIGLAVGLTYWVCI